MRLTPEQTGSGTAWFNPAWFNPARFNPA